MLWLSVHIEDYLLLDLQSNGDFFRVYHFYFNRWRAVKAAATTTTPPTEDEHEIPHLKMTMELHDKYDETIKMFTLSDGFSTTFRFFSSFFFLSTLTAHLRLDCYSRCSMYFSAWHSIESLLKARDLMIRSICASFAIHGQCWNVLPETSFRRTANSHSTRYERKKLRIEKSFHQLCGRLNMN